MKVDAICKDVHGAEATVMVDLDYVNVNDYNLSIPYGTTGNVLYVSL